MEIILMENINNLGQKDEIVEVADGYARNFLIPKNLALKATPGNVKQCKEKKKLIQQKREKGKFKALRVAEKLRGVRLVLEREMGEEGKLFGVVTSQDIVQEIKKRFSLEIDHRKVNLDEPIRVIGIKKVSLKLHPEVEIDLEVELKKCEKNTKRAQNG